ncbi:MAG: TlpA family protein disulfide reductase [Acidobacteria bacterium]|nr:TlpA family protein disulfide reductase [Acidobacteriota bacterium]
MKPLYRLSLGIAVVATVAASSSWYLRGISVRAAGAQPASGQARTIRFLRDPVPVPSFTARDLEGRTVAPERWRGKVTLVNFWATWCPPCRAEIPDLIALQAKYRDQLQIIGVSQDEGSVESVRRFAEEHKINYVVVMATPELQKSFPGVFGLPTTFLLDRDARIAQKHIGLLNPTVTEDEVRALAGLSVNAGIESVQDTGQVRLENAAHATEIPGLDLRQVPLGRRAELLQKLNADQCTCGCRLTLAQCRINDPSCTVSLPLALEVVRQFVAKP